MQERQLGPLEELAEQFTDYLPTLAAGLFVLLLGLVVGWIAKRVVIRLLTLLRLDRLGGRAGWRSALRKGDVRAGLYNLVGSIVMFLVILLFLDNALQILGLLVLSKMIGSVSFYLPNLAIVVLIVAIGVALSNVVADWVEDLLEEEGFARARLAGRLVRAAFVTLAGAVALWQLNLARQIVLAGFLITFGATGIAFAIAVGLGSVKAIQRSLEGLFQKHKSD